jgi:hypothetical protein
VKNHRPDRSGWIALLVVLLMGLLLIHGFQFMADLLRRITGG